MFGRVGLQTSLLALFALAFKSRCSLPILVSVGFMLLDFQLTLDLEVEAHVLAEENQEGHVLAQDNTEQEVL